jgi:uncharacterized protein YcbK (DUF882 family)
MILRAAHWRDVAPGDWPFTNFSPKEMADRRSGDLAICLDFMEWLARLRGEYGKPIRVTSGYRTPQHQRELTGRDTGAHVDGQAVDIAVSGYDAEQLERLAIAHGALGRGIFQAGPHAGRYLHLDRWDKREGVPIMWSY